MRGLALPPEIGQLMQTPVSWEKYSGSMNGYGEPSYAAALTKHCWVEEHGMFGGGMEPERFKEQTVVVPLLDCYFDGRDPDVQTFSLFDRFSFTKHVPAVGSGVVLQPIRIVPWYGPNFDNKGDPWIVVVAF